MAQHVQRVFIPLRDDFPMLVNVGPAELEHVAALTRVALSQSNGLKHVVRVHVEFGNQWPLLLRVLPEPTKV